MMKKCAVHGCKQEALYKIVSHGEFYEVCRDCWKRIKGLRWDEKHYGEDLLAEMKRGYQENMVF
jgi:hypothetical protein